MFVTLGKLTPCLCVQGSGLQGRLSGAPSSKRADGGGLGVPRGSPAFPGALVGDAFFLLSLVGFWDELASGFLCGVAEM